MSELAKFVCPKCGKQSVVIVMDSIYNQGNEKLKCTNCGWQILIKDLKVAPQYAALYAQLKKEVTHDPVTEQELKDKGLI